MCPSCASLRVVGGGGVASNGPDGRPAVRPDADGRFTRSGDGQKVVLRCRCGGVSWLEGLPAIGSLGTGSPGIALLGADRRTRRRNAGGAAAALFGARSRTFGTMAAGYSPTTGIGGVREHEPDRLLPEGVRRAQLHGGCQARPDVGAGPHQGRPRPRRGARRAAVQVGGGRPGRAHSLCRGVPRLLPRVLRRARAAARGVQAARRAGGRDDPPRRGHRLAESARHGPDLRLSQGARRG